jgi:hypothetical protein
LNYKIEANTGGMFLDIGLGSDLFLHITPKIQATKVRVVWWRGLSGRVPASQG